MTPITSLIAIIGTLIVALLVSVWLPGIERKFVQARIQQRVGPPISSAGIMAPLKFFFKETIKPNSPMPKLYNALPIVSFLSVLFILLILMPQLYVFAAFTSIIAIVGLLKIEEVIYMFMGSLSKSVMSLKMPFPDIVKGAKHPDTHRLYLEELSSLRAYRLIAFGFFPIVHCIICSCCNVKEYILEWYRGIPTSSWTNTLHTSRCTGCDCIFHRLHDTSK